MFCSRFARSVGRMGRSELIERWPPMQPTERDMCPSVYDEQLTPASVRGYESITR